ncbi:hypothetical protein [uncultured Pantoea sp.]|uniref:hypothetical protein n=1 Tax=uncultured Pantoea sp. TaxID=218084 RepID=UPI00259012F6|nr:hypothetical protein [uncultured Pantoea sp.]
MDDFTFDNFFDGLKQRYNQKVTGVNLALTVLDWGTEPSDIARFNLEIQRQVNFLLSDPAARRDWHQKVCCLLDDVSSTVQDTVNEWLYLSAMYWHLGLGTLHADKTKGVELLLKGIEFLDYCRGFIEREFWQIELDSKHVIPKQGGKTKAARFDAVKAEIIRLLKIAPPAGGWERKQDALRDIEDGLNSYITNHGWPSATDNNNKSKSEAELFALRERTILDWSRNDPDVKAVFDSVIKSKKRKAR